MPWSTFPSRCVISLLCSCSRHNVFCFFLLSDPARLKMHTAIMRVVSLLMVVTPVLGVTAFRRPSASKVLSSASTIGRRIRSDFFSKSAPMRRKSESVSMRMSDVPVGALDGSSWRGGASISKLTESVSHKFFDIEAIKNILPHRFPFLLVDKVIEFEAGKRAVGVKQITSNEDQFNGHFPSRAVMPGVLQVEALAQLCGIVALQQPVSDGKGNFFFAAVDGVKWKVPVVPGDSLVMEVLMDLWRPEFGLAKFNGKGYVNGKTVIEVKHMTFAMVK
eukprot:GHVQ01004675.1.p1 GENE.GHVQ01004675.1~~GHVQ01004675.1.p1  ORF type:complete len:276 (+),score=14.09 GHVQ01004675.1:421-1248(+)